MPRPYTGPIRRIDGTIPSDPNHYLWPLDADWYWAHRSFGHHRCSSRWHFSAVALADGRWLADGFVREDEKDMRFFPTREAALRHSAAEMLRTIRSARSWPKGYASDHVSPEMYVNLVRWTFEKLGLPSLSLTVKPESEPQPWADLPLFTSDPSSTVPTGK
jgi:hypothetical protein